MRWDQIRRDETIRRCVRRSEMVNPGGEGCAPILLLGLCRRRALHGLLNGGVCVGMGSDLVSPGVRVCDGLLWVF
jgi:hypothetical protein